NKCYIAKDPQRKPEGIPHETVRDNGRLNVVFLSRICEKKNLLGAIQILENAKGNVNFSIYGNIEDENYYNLCVQEMSKLKNNITCEYKGIADSEDVPKILSQYDVFLFPTHGENFGHVISEALSAGVIPVISDTTPWLDFKEYNAGYVINHSDLAAFTECIDLLSSVDENKLKEMSANVIDYYARQYNDSITNNGYTEMFDELLR
ncbi:MAG: glycosyltransferase, partial [Lachnospiraceae bacterium]|nr:glycosyltransferase [Lachnospiraceae bacterium]